MLTNCLPQDDQNEDEDEDDEDNENDEVDRKPEQIAAPEYRRLIAIHAGKGKGGLDDWLKIDPNKVRRLSLSEVELEKATVTRAKDIIRYHFSSSMVMLLVFHIHHEHYSLELFA